MHPPIGLLRLAGYDRLIFYGAVTTIIFGVLNVLYGLSMLGDRGTFGAEVVLGLGALQIVLGIVDAVWRHPLTFVTEGGALLLLAAWNAFLIGWCAAHADEYAPPRTAAQAFLIQMAAAFFSFRHAVRYYRIRREHGILAGEDSILCKRFLDALRKRPADATVLDAGVRQFIGRAKCRILLADDVAIFVSSLSLLDPRSLDAIFGDPVFVASRESVAALVHRFSFLGFWRKNVIVPAARPGERRISVLIRPKALAALKAWAAPEGWDAPALARERAVSLAYERARSSLRWAIAGLFLYVPMLVALPLALVARASLRRAGAPPSGRASAALGAALGTFLVLGALGVAAALVPAPPRAQPGAGGPR